MRKELESVSAQLEKARLQREQQRKKAAGDAEVPDDLIDEQLDKDLRAGKLREQQERLQRIITEYEKVARDGPDVPELVSSSLRGYKADLEAVKKQLQERRRETRERVQRQLKQFNDEAARQNLKRLDDDIALLIAEEQTLRQRLAEQAKDVEKHSRGSAAEVEKLLKEIERRQGVVKAFGDECAARRRDILAAPRVVLVQEAAAP
jgi:hypothetical protein